MQSLQVTSLHILQRASVCVLTQHSAPQRKFNEFMYTQTIRGHRNQIDRRRVGRKARHVVHVTCDLLKHRRALATYELGYLKPQHCSAIYQQSSTNKRDLPVHYGTSSTFSKESTQSLRLLSVAHVSVTMASIARPTCVPLLISRNNKGSPPSTSVTGRGCQLSTAPPTSTPPSAPDPFPLSTVSIPPALPGHMSLTVSACCKNSCPVLPLSPGRTFGSTIYGARSDSLFQTIPTAAVSHVCISPSCLCARWKATF